jgi:GT2 family glycosyltransferase
MRPRIVILGFLSHFPVAGVAWQTIHYLIGFQRLGFDVYYVEAHGCTASKLMQSDTDDGPARAAAYIDSVLRQFDLGDKWAYHAPYPEARHFGLSETQLKDLYHSAALIINLHGSHLPTEELTATNRLVFVETDPVDTQIDLFNKRQETHDYLAPHCAHFTYGENFGHPDCLVPVSEQFKFLPTRQPVVMEFWEDCQSNGAADMFTTIGNWQQPWREVKFKGETYRWSKHFEFLKFIDLPKRTTQRFELALSSYRDQDRRMLENKGWCVRHAIDFTQHLDAYRRYIAESRGEFTVAKDQNIRLRSGWFSDRAATYLAAGRPVVTQETGFSNIFPTGEGLFAFATMDEILAAIDAINRDYERHRRAAFHIAREYFCHEVVLGKLLSDLGISAPTNNRTTFSLSRSAREEKVVNKSEPTSKVIKSLADSLALTPTGRWPTRLPEQTLQAALALPTPVFEQERTEVVRLTFSQEATEETEDLKAGLSQMIKETEIGDSPLPPLTPVKETLEISEVQQEVTEGTGILKPLPNCASIIIVTHNGLPYTKMCLASLSEAGWAIGDELIIVDNASTDGTADYYRDLLHQNGCSSRREEAHSFSESASEICEPPHVGCYPGLASPRIQIIFNSENRGFARANNQGLAAARGEYLILLNNDTLVLPDWRDKLLAWLRDPSVGLVGPVTNRTCNEAQIDAPYRTYGELLQFARERSPSSQLRAPSSQLEMLAMFCLALRRDTFDKIGPLDEQFGIGMFEDDDYARRARQLGYRILCAEDVFVHHFGQGSFGELCQTGEYDKVFETNRRRFEAKWGVAWRPHGRRITSEYQDLRERIKSTVSQKLPKGAAVAIISKGDEELLKLTSQSAWHFPQAKDGSYPNIYPADSAEAIAHLESLRQKGAAYLLIPKPAFWWLDYYAAFKQHLERLYPLAMEDADTCLVFNLGGAHA